MPQPVIAAFRTADGAPSLLRSLPASAIVLFAHPEYGKRGLLLGFELSGALASCRSIHVDDLTTLVCAAARADKVRALLLAAHRAGHQLRCLQIVMPAAISLP